MSGPQPEALHEWATARRLSFVPAGSLPQVTRRLRLGVGVGEHRAAMRTITDRGRVYTQGDKKRPERETAGLCTGMLPGGIEGRVGHHVHLTDQGRGQEDRYIAQTDTVLFTELSVRARPVFHLEGGKASGEVKAAFTVGKASEMNSPLDGVVLAPHGRVESGGLSWESFPAESDERIRRIVSTATRQLDELPWERVTVEYECGRLAVWVVGMALTDPAQLDALCRFASGLAQGFLEVSESAEQLEPGRSLPLPEPDAREKWVADGAALVEWDEPPVSIVAAQERYKKEVNPRATRSGWKVYGVVAVSLFIFGLLGAVASLLLGLAVNQYPMPIAVMVAVISVGLGAIAANRVGLETGQEAIEDRLNSSAVPWGIEAFADGYATRTGLLREDHEEFRRRLEVPFNGRCQIAWQGELNPGQPGHISVWIDATNTPEPPRFFLLAVTDPCGKEAPAGYQSLERSRQRLVWQEVTSVQRAIHRLDQLRGAARE